MGKVEFDQKTSNIVNISIRQVVPSQALWSWITATFWAWHFAYGPHANYVFAGLFVAMAIVQTWRWWVYKKLEEKGRAISPAI